jgi:MFS family permease
MESFNFVKKEKLVNQALLAMFFGMFIVGVIQVLLPDFAKEILKLNEKERGTLMGMLGLGLLLGSLFSLSIAKLIGRGKCILLSISLSGILMIVIATITNPILSMSVLFIAGLFLGTVTSFVPSIIQAATPNNLRGRVMSYFSLVFLLTPAISGLGYGFLADKIGLVNVFIISGIVAISMGLLGWIILTDLKIADKKLNLPS